MWSTTSLITRLSELSDQAIQYIYGLLLTLLLILGSSIALSANSLDITQADSEALGQYTHILNEGNAPLSPQQAYLTLTSEHTNTYPQPVISEGVGAPTMWLMLRVHNPTKLSIPKRLSIETAWLDEVSVYIFQHDQLQDSIITGDQYPFSQRPIIDRFFHSDIDFLTGETILLLRVATPDPKVIPLYLRDAAQQTADSETHAYFYGFVYGVIIGLLLYNLVLAVSLRKSVYLYYSLYMLAFLLTNSSYTGHNFRYLWPESPHWQQWSNAVFMTLHVAAGLSFAIHFLAIKQQSIRLFRVLQYARNSMLVLLVLAIAMNSHSLAIKLAFVYMSAFAFLMIYLGLISLKFDSRATRYFLLATCFGAGGAMITCITVMGLTPYRQWAFLAIDMGMMLEAILLALALADQFQRAEQEKIIAERLSITDPLTGLHNRRAFTEQFLLPPSTDRKQHRLLSIILLDLDFFKHINDNYGHPTGDKVLVKVAKTLQQLTRQNDFLARWGGEEFIISLPDTTLEQAVQIAERYRKGIEAIQMSAPLINKINTIESFSFTASLGVACNKREAISIDELISTVDRRLYAAKNQGRNCTVWQAENDQPTKSDDQQKN